MGSRRRLSRLGALCAGLASVIGAPAAAVNQRPLASSRPDGPLEIVRRVPVSDHASAIIRFDHAAGTAWRIVVDDASGRIVEERALPGRPQSARLEFEDALAIIGRDDALAELMAGGAEPEGGFIVDGPAGAPPRHRYIQVRLLSPDRRRLLRVAVVDLTAGVVASARPWFE